MKVYKIQNRDGMFSTGGSDPQWKNKGKVWKNIGHVKNHLHQFVGKYTSERGSLFYDGSSVIEYELLENELGSVLDPVYFISDCTRLEFERWQTAEQLEYDLKYQRAKKIVEEYEAKKHNP